VGGITTLVLGCVVIGASLLGVRGRIYYLLARSWARVTLWASASPVIIEGMDRIDWSEPKVLVANHISDFDVLALAGSLPVPYAFVAKKELERVPFFGTAWKAAGHISIDRSDREKAVQSLQRAGEKMRREKTVVIIFPEGTRSRTGETQPFKKGAFVLAQEARVPIVPVAIRGSDRIKRPGSPRIDPGPIYLNFLPPVEPASFAGQSVDELMEAVRAAMCEALRKPV
jgi:1-acyl-sn-glycerol-3-phosphate acyltransferase